MSIDAQDLANRYAAVWNEADDVARRAAVAALWHADGAHWVGTREARGLAALEVRVADAWRKNVHDNGYAFRAVQDAQALRDGVVFHWEMIRPQTQQVAAVGLEFLQLDATGRILRDYQYIIG